MGLPKPCTKKRGLSPVSVVPCFRPEQNQTTERRVE
jgi:hypothetical protein